MYFVRKRIECISCNSRRGARENNFNSATYGERENGDMGAAFADGRRPGARCEERKVLKDHAAVAHSWRDGEQ